MGSATPTTGVPTAVPCPRDLMGATLGTTAKDRLLKTAEHYRRLADKTGRQVGGGFEVVRGHSLAGLECGRYLAG
jgi:hypothetical protein